MPGRRNTTAAPAAEWVPLDRVRPWPKNPDPPSPKDVRDIARSIKRFGFGEPILARLADGEVIAGHARLLAAKRLKLEQIPVRFIDLPEPEAHALALADNKLASNRKRHWKSDEMADLLEELDADGIDIENGMGFSNDELDRLLDQNDEGEEARAMLDTALRYGLVIDCKDERDQAELLERLESEGYTCKPMMT